MIKYSNSKMDRAAREEYSDPAEHRLTLCHTVGSNCAWCDQKGERGRVSCSVPGESV